MSLGMGAAVGLVEVAGGVVGSGRGVCQSFIFQDREAWYCVPGTEFGVVLLLLLFQVLLFLTMITLMAVMAVVECHWIECTSG
jgi:hypothetical protein